MNITAHDKISYRCVAGVLIDGVLSELCYEVNTKTKEYSTYVPAHVEGEILYDEHRVPVMARRHADSIVLLWKADHAPCTHCKRLRT